MNNAKEIAEKILNCKTYNTTEMQNLARAYLELEKELNLGKSALRCGQCGNIGMFHNGFAMADELTKLKKSRDVLRKACEVIARGESQFDNVDHMYTAREALKADDEVMK